MKKSIFVIFMIGAIVFFFGCQEEAAIAPELNESNQVTNPLEKPSPNLIGTTYTPFNFPPLPDPGGSDIPVFWKGTIVLGEDTYGIYFLSYTAPREFSQASPFYEEFVIHENNDEGNIYMKGWNSGVVTNANNPPDDPSNFLANGKITEAYGPLEAWHGCNWHIRGLVFWRIDGSGLPDRAEGTCRIN